MFILEYKQLHIVKDNMRKNCTCQSYRWKQYAMCEEREPLDEIMSKQKRPENWRIVTLDHAKGESHACQENQ